MALFHVATLTPSKTEMIEGWIPTQTWGPRADQPIEVVGAFRFDDPEGMVGIETHIVRAGGTLYQVPLTYRNEALEGADDALLGTMEHSALGTRWVYDGLGDDRYLTMLAAVAMTGQGEALGLAEHEGRWYVAPANVRIEGGGWTGRRVPLDRFEAVGEEADVTILRNDGFELRFHRRPASGSRPDLGLAATWEGQDHPVVLAQVVPLGAR
ncbi:MAG: hypothetical protein HKN24_04400 [Acidimicrobiales bacterium]|nr:hypothetical protein [Acidimicrobiales bacterium]